MCECDRCVAGAFDPASVTLVEAWYDECGLPLLSGRETALQPCRATSVLVSLGKSWTHSPLRLPVDVAGVESGGAAVGAGLSAGAGASGALAVSVVIAVSAGGSEVTPSISSVSVLITPRKPSKPSSKQRPADAKPRALSSIAGGGVSSGCGGRSTDDAIPRLCLLPLSCRGCQSLKSRPR